MELQGRIQDFFRRGCTRLLLFFNTNKPHFFFFLQNTSRIRKPQVISGGRGVRTPCSLPLDPPLNYPLILVLSYRDGTCRVVHTSSIGKKRTYSVNNRSNVTYLRCSACIFYLLVSGCSRLISGALDCPKDVYCLFSCFPLLA